jgi:FkbM family methyltransferase
MQIKRLLRGVMPFEIVDRHRQRCRMRGLGLSPTPERAAAVEICRYDLWPTFLRRGSRAWNLVDVGANDGLFIAAVHSLVELQSVFAFEPLAACHAPLERALSGVRCHQLFRAAVGAIPGELELNCTRNSKMSSVLKPRSEIAKAYQVSDFQVVGRAKVPLVTLDATLPDDLPIDLLKVDVQGFEREVLAGASRTLHRTRSVLLEVNYRQHYEGGAGFEEMLALLHSSGFRVFGISAPYCSRELGPLWADAMFVRLDELH